LRFAKKYKRIPDHKDPKQDMFSDKYLEKKFHEEDSIKYSDQDKIDNKISHRSVMYIAHDIFIKIKKENDEKVQRKQELSALRN